MSNPFLNSQRKINRFILYRDFVQLKRYYYIPTEFEYSEIEISSGGSYSSVRGLANLNLVAGDINNIKSQLGNDIELVPVNTTSNNNQPVLNSDFNLSDSQLDLSLINTLPFPSYNLSIVLMGKDNNQNTRDKIKDYWSQRKLLSNKLGLSFSGINSKLNYNYNFNLNNLAQRMLSGETPQNIITFQEKFLKVILESTNLQNSADVPAKFKNSVLVALFDILMKHLRINGVERFCFDDNLCVNVVNPDNFTLEIINRSQISGLLSLSENKSLTIEVSY